MKTANPRAEPLPEHGEGREGDPRGPRGLCGNGAECEPPRSRSLCAAASVALKRLVGHGPKNRFYRATRELGRVFKTEFILDYLSQPALRTRIRRGLLKGEQLHALARCVHYGRLDQRDFERQTGAASCLLLILAAIIYWQIREIDRVLSEAGSDADDLNFELLSNISPIGWDNVLLFGLVPRFLIFMKLSSPPGVIEPEAGGPAHSGAEII